MNGEDLVGVWQLEQFEVAFSDRRPPMFPFGHGATGLLVHGPDGAMSLTIAARRRGELAIEGVEELLTAPDGPKARSFETFMSYAGGWTFDGACVTHHAEVASIPAMAATEQVRGVEFRAGLLVLVEVVTAASGVEGRFEQIWRRRR